MPVGLAAKSWIIGCACDRKYVEPTAVMLTSLTENGDVPEAVVLVAAFGLTEDDVALLRAGAGALADRLNVIDVTHEMLRGVDEAGCTEAYPGAVLGRLFLPYAVQTDGARLLTLDSDMIVNAAINPLFETDFGEEFFGAVHDLPRWDDQDYFNSGMMLIDVDTYVYHDIGMRCLKWLNVQSERPRWPDQDALNAIVGSSWRRLDRSWNFTHYNDHADDGLSYASANIAHFTARPKPWDQEDHVGFPLYSRYRQKLRERLGSWRYGCSRLVREVLPTCYELFLGRQLESESVLHQRGDWQEKKLVTSVVTSAECRGNALRWIDEGVRPSLNLFEGRPALRLRLWAADCLELELQTRAAVAGAETWLELLSHVLGDRTFRKAYGLEPAARTSLAIGLAAE